MTIGIGFCYGPCSTCSTTYGYLSPNACGCSCHHASVSISSTTSGLVLSTSCSSSSTRRFLTWILGDY